MDQSPVEYIPMAWIVPIIPKVYNSRIKWIHHRKIHYNSRTKWFVKMNEFSMTLHSHVPMMGHILNLKLAVFNFEPVYYSSLYEEHFVKYIFIYVFTSNTLLGHPQWGAWGKHLPTHPPAGCIKGFDTAVLHHIVWHPAWRASEHFSQQRGISTNCLSVFSDDLSFCFRRTLVPGVLWYCYDLLPFKTRT